MVLYYAQPEGFEKQKAVADKGCSGFAGCEGIVLLDVTDAVLQRKKRGSEKRGNLPFAVLYPLHLPSCQSCLSCMESRFPLSWWHTSITPAAKYCIFYLNLFFELKDKFSCSLPLALGLKHTLLIRENPLRWFRCWRLFVCWLFCHLFQEHIITWVWIAQNAVGVFGFAESLFEMRKTKQKTRHFLRFRLLNWFFS